MRSCSADLEDLLQARLGVDDQVALARLEVDVEVVGLARRYELHRAVERGGRLAFEPAPEPLLQFRLQVLGILSRLEADQVEPGRLLGVVADRSGRGCGRGRCCTGPILRRLRDIAPTAPGRRTASDFGSTG